MSGLLTPREFRFIALLVIGLGLLGFVACGHGSSSASANPSATPAASASPQPRAPATGSPAAVATAPTPGGQVASLGTGDTQVTISPATYASASDPCLSVAHDVTVASAPRDCGAVWSNLGSGDVPGADLMNSMPMPHTVGVGPGVSSADAIAAATAFYRWQAFQTWAENGTNLVSMQALDPPGHADPVVSALAVRGSRVTSVPNCNLPVLLRVVRLDQTAADYVRSQGWNVVGGLAVVATYPACEGVTVSYSDGTTKVVGASPGLTAINPGEVETMAPYGDVWRIEGEVGCGTTATAVAAVCNGGS